MSVRRQLDPTIPPRTHLLLAAAFTVAIVALAACGDDGAATTVPATTVPATTVPTTQPVGTGAATTTADEPPDITATTAGGPTDGGGRVVEDGDAVEVHYTGTLDDGSEFDSSRGRSPLSFVVGSGQVIPGFDEAVRGLAVGESRTVRIEPEQAYGQPDPALILEFPAAEAPDGLTVGEQVTLGDGSPGTVIEITDAVVRIDANHRLAGEALTFTVELVSIG